VHLWSGWPAGPEGKALREINFDVVGRHDGAARWTWNGVGLMLEMLICWSNFKHRIATFASSILVHSHEKN
jgi:hypothetical protein